MELVTRDRKQQVEDEEVADKSKTMYDPYGFIDHLEEMKPLLLWCKEKADSVPSPLEQGNLGTLFRENNFLYFPTAVKFTRWLFQRRRGNVRPWCILLTGWREAQPCAAAMLAARTGDVSRLRADAKRPPLREIDYDEDVPPLEPPVQPRFENKKGPVYLAPKNKGFPATTGCGDTSSSDSQSCDMDSAMVGISVAAMVVVPTMGHQENMAHRWASGPGLATGVPTYIASTPKQTTECLRTLAAVTIVEHLSARCTLQHLSL